MKGKFMEEITKEDIVREAQNGGFTSRLVTTFSKTVLTKYTVSEILHCNETALVKRTRGLGKKMEELIAYLRKTFCKKIHDEKMLVDAEQIIRNCCNQLEEELKKIAEGLNPVITLGELQGVVSMMELMGLKDIDLVQIHDFLDAMRVRSGKGVD